MKKLIIQTIKTDLHLSIYKIVMIANFLSIILIVGYLTHHFLPPIFSSFSFLKLDFIDVIVLVAFPFLGIFYTYLLILLIPWLLLLIIGNGDLIAYFALLLASFSFYTFFLFFLLFLFFVFYCFQKQQLLSKNKKTNIMILIWILATFLSAIFSSFWMTFLNWIFILDLYNQSSLKTQIFTIFLPFNFLKFILQAIIYSCFLIPLLVIIKKYTQQNYYILL